MAAGAAVTPGWPGKGSGAELLPSGDLGAVASGPECSDRGPGFLSLTRLLEGVDQTPWASSWATA
jgi:hypothetical protein